MKISVVIPTYNRAELLLKTVDSVLRQTYDDFEVVVIDDGSTDDTRTRVERFSDSNKFRYHYKKNERRSVARNTGAALATGDWLLFLDSDDLLVETALAMLANGAAKNADAGIVSGNAAFIDSDGAITVAAANNSFYQNLDLIRGEMREPYCRLVRKAYFITGTFIIKKTVFEQSGGFDPRLDICEDLDWLLRAVLHCRVFCLSETVTLKRNHEGNTDATEIERASVAVGDKHLQQVVSRLPAAQKRRAAAEWSLRTADNLYNLGQNARALNRYLRAAYFEPKYLTENRFRRQLAACLFPVKLKNKVRKLKQARTNAS